MSGYKYIPKDVRAKDFYLSKNTILLEIAHQLKRIADALEK